MAGKPRAAVAGKERGPSPGLVVVSAQGCSSLSRERTPWILCSCQQTRGSLGAGAPGGAQGGPPLPQECEMLPHMQLAFILQSFFFPLSVFPTHVLLPESILIMHDFFFYGASFPASLSAAESEKIVIAATSEAVKCPCSAQLLSFIIPAPLRAACSLPGLRGGSPCQKPDSCYTSW